MKIFKRYPRTASVLLMLLSLSLVTACAKGKKDSDIAYYTCPMHPQIKMDQPGNCPICGMDLVPVTKSELQGGGPEATPETQTMDKDQGIRIDPTRVQNIGVKTAEAKLRPLQKTILFQGKVAHDPKLWVAQKEYIVALNLGDPSLIRAAEDKLRFMGLSTEWIHLIKKTRRANLWFHLPNPGAPTLFEAFINQGDIHLIHSGLKVKIYDPDAGELAEGVVRAVGTLLEMDTRTVRALIQADRYLDLKSNTFVQLKVEMDLGERLSVPKQAVLMNGDHNMVYVETGPGRFVGKKVTLGEAAGDFYEIEEGLAPGEQVVTNGNFLIDSESRIRLGAGGGHQH